MQASQPLGKGISKYDPIPAALSATPASLDPRADPVVALLRSSSLADSKYDPVMGFLNANPNAPGVARSDPLGALSQMSAPQASGKYDPLHDALRVEAEPSGQPRKDLLGSLAKLSVPEGNGKYDPLPGALAAEARPIPSDRLDPIRGLIRALLKPRQAGHSSKTLNALGQDLQNLLNPQQAGVQPPQPVYPETPALSSTAKGALEPKAISQTRDRPLDQKQHGESLPSEEHLSSGASPSVTGADAEERTGKDLDLPDILVSSESTPTAASTPSNAFKWSEVQDDDRQTGGPSSKQETGRWNFWRRRESPAKQQSKAQAMEPSPAPSTGQPGNPIPVAFTEMKKEEKAPKVDQQKGSEEKKFDPSFVKAQKPQPAKAPTTGLAVDSTDPRLNADQRANIISRQPPFKRPFAAVHPGNTWPEDLDLPASNVESIPRVSKGLQRASTQAKDESPQARMQASKVLFDYLKN